MNWKSVRIILAGIVLASCGAPEDAAAPDAAAPAPGPSLMIWSDLTERALPEPDSTHAYGADPAQVADLWLPDGAGPHPVVLMVHGGCWQKAIADRTLMNYAAHDLKNRGLAVWNIEYRGVDEADGGYPGTFLDVSAASAKLMELAPGLNLETDNMVGFGHSAGGHLIAWLAAQPNLPAGSALASDQDLPLSAVIVSGGLADLEASLPVTLESCLADIIDDLTGPQSATRSDVFADTSLANLLPTRTVLISVNGDSDRIAPPELGMDLTDKAQAAGAAAIYVEVPNTGHVELISPGTEAFDVQAELMLEHLQD